MTQRRQLDPVTGGCEDKTKGWRRRAIVKRLLSRAVASRKRNSGKMSLVVTNWGEESPKSRDQREDGPSCQSTELPRLNC